MLELQWLNNKKHIRKTVLCRDAAQRDGLRKIPWKITDEP